MKSWVYRRPADLDYRRRRLPAAIIITDLDYVGSGTFTLGSVTANGTGTFTAPVYTGTATMSLQALEVVGTGTAGAAVFTGTGALTLGVVTASGAGTRVAPVYTGTGVGVLPAVTAQGTGAYRAQGHLVLGPLAVSGSGTFTAFVYEDRLRHSPQDHEAICLRQTDVDVQPLRRAPRRTEEELQLERV